MHRPAAPPFEIRCPLHGAIEVDGDELAVIEAPFLQRLRGIRQLGEPKLPFPGATHSRYAHSLGVMHLAGRAFDSCFRDDPFSSKERRRAYRHVVRLAALCHDVGHPPFSHAAEFGMPPLLRLQVGAYAPAKVAHRLHERATHEDYTVAILTGSELSQRIRRHFPFTPQHVAALISPEVSVSDDFFVDRGVDLRPLMSQLISSDLDVDRLDYLRRDSWYSGARYGEVDVPWLLSHLTRHIDDGDRACLALDRRALYAFDDFMLARFHMFVMVYFHQKSVAYERMLQRYMEDPGCDYQLPADLERYLLCDDAELVQHLRSSDSPWAQRLIGRSPFKLAVEVHGRPEEIDLTPYETSLRDAGLEVLEASATGYVYRPRKADKAPIYLVDARTRGPAVPLDEVAEIYRRYDDALRIARLYVAQEEMSLALRVLGAA